MNWSLVLSFILIVGCASTKDKTETELSTITKDSFKKETPLSNKDISDYYSGQMTVLSPALSDETMDLYSSDEREKYPDTKDPLAKISNLCSKRKFQEAFKIASHAFQKYQKTALYWNQVANCHLNQGSHRKALLFYNKALEVSPNYVPALNNIGVMYSRQGQDQKAQVAFEKASALSKFSKTPRYNLAKLYLSYGLAAEALPILNGLLGQSPSDMELLNAVASSYFLMSNYQQALAHFRRIPQSEWSRPEIGLNFAISLSKIGNKKDARKIFENVKKPNTRTLREYYSVVEKNLGGRE